MTFSWGWRNVDHIPQSPKRINHHWHHHTQQQHEPLVIQNLLHEMRAYPTWIWFGHFYSSLKVDELAQPTTYDSKKLNKSRSLLSKTFSGQVCLIAKSTSYIWNKVNLKIVPTIANMLSKINAGKPVSGCGLATGSAFESNMLSKTAFVKTYFG